MSKLKNDIPAHLLTILLLTTPQPTAFAQTSQLLVGTINPRVACLSDPNQTYALYLPPGCSTNRQWPILYFFDPFARGETACQILKPAAAKYGYIIAASNNSKNGPMGGSKEAAIAMWDDTHSRLPVDTNRCYASGMSGGARVAVSVALSCGDCVAGVIPDAAGFPPGATPPRPMKFACFAAVGDADPNYPEFVKLRRELDRVNARYRIRVFEGSHGWAPPEVWMEALDWMDIQAMGTGALPRDNARIAIALQEALARAQAFESTNNMLAAFREYQSAVRDFDHLADVSSAKAKLAGLEKNRELKTAEKREAAGIEEQQRIVKDPAIQMQKLAAGTFDATEFSKLLSTISELKSKAATQKDLPLRRALAELVVRAYDSAQACTQTKNYSAALGFFRLAVEGSITAAFAHYERGRIYAMTSRKKEMLEELRLALSQGYHDPSALQSDEFRPYRDDTDFQALVADWNKSNANKP